MMKSEQRRQQSHTLKTESASTWRVLTEFSLNSNLGLEITLAQVAAASRAMNLPAICRERLALAVTETFRTVTSNTPQDQRLVIRVLTSAAIIAAELLQQEQGWGFFLVEKYANDQRVCPTCQEIDLYLYLEGGDNDN